MARLYCVMLAVLVVLLQVYMAAAGRYGGVIYKKLHHVGYDDSLGYDDSPEHYGYKGGYGGHRGYW